MSFFVTVILIIIIAIYLLPMIARALLRNWINRKTEQFNQAAGGYQNAQRQRRGSAKEGEVRVERADIQKKKKVSSSVGDYVEYEEITEVTPEEKE